MTNIRENPDFMPTQINITYVTVLSNYSSLETRSRNFQGIQLLIIIGLVAKLQQFAKTSSIRHKQFEKKQTKDDATFKLKITVFEVET